MSDGNVSLGPKRPRRDEGRVKGRVEYAAIWLRAVYGEIEGNNPLGGDSFVYFIHVGWVYAIVSKGGEEEREG